MSRIFSVAIAVISGVVALFIIGAWISKDNINRPNPNRFLPWHIEYTSEGAPIFFGLVLGYSTLQEAELSFRLKSDVSLFVAPDGKSVVEGYFDEVNLAGLTSIIIVSVELSDEYRSAIYNRGTRISTLGNGTRKVNLTTEDAITIRKKPISSLTYLPKIRLDPEQIEHRFGKPTQQIHEADKQTEHWLYPKLGLDVVLGANITVLQYVDPKKFSSLIAPLIR